VYLAENGQDDVAKVLAASAFISVTVASIFGRGSAKRNARRHKREKHRRPERHSHHKGNQESRN
jgi:nitrogen regulatory protein PII